MLWTAEMPIKVSFAFVHAFSAQNIAYYIYLKYSSMLLFLANNTMVPKVIFRTQGAYFHYAGLAQKYGYDKKYTSIFPLICIFIQSIHLK